MTLENLEEIMKEKGDLPDNFAGAEAVCIDEEGNDEVPREEVA
eukprot:CAMPEP_0197833720 /NCGR_PEP_ID=MMETSP1437-20131217/19914_1 /TAXON_ID=49252 ORGANISM="Eucampia antarctica, Strain CCMP1452" /NCGR_SAMPLE_ID=MMETSP1437 /ASSEMBLY_ACC=CAM_ASM_001096 /LENGTH=42 /DNA_ID= /DNA_START= /DNA_END= /DNA_ORIENTATION=